MKRDVLFVFQIAVWMFVSVFLVALYARPARSTPNGPAHSATVCRTLFVVEYKYVNLADKLTQTLAESSRKRTS